MKQSTNRRKALNAARDPVSEYMAVLHDVYPPSTGAIGVVSPDRRCYVNDGAAPLTNHVGGNFPGTT